VIDFKKRLKKQDTLKKTNPIEIYDTLDRHSETGPLRPSQEKILKDWYENRFDKNNNIIKLHTGEGKTLIGLLLLQAKLNTDGLPCVYVCPNIYLAEQVKQEARKFGIPFCGTNQSSDLPDEFLSGKSILITYVQKVFHGKSIFGLGNKSIDIGSIILDDSHSCIDSIKDALTIKVQNVHDLYKDTIGLFSEDIKEQGEGSFLEIEGGDYSTMLPIPYWSWYDKKDEIISAIAKHKDDDKIKFIWPIIKDSIANCQAFISGATLEISPTLMPIEKFGVFSKAKHRILMSATTQDDSFFIKGLGFDIDSVSNPLTNTDLKWSGEKMILIPSLIDESLTQELIVNWLAKPSESKKYGIVGLVPSFNFKQQYEKIGAKVATSVDIFDIVKSLKDGNFSETIVFVNRYDGIDLPDDSCRILILDSKPFFDSLLDRYEEDCRSKSDVVNIRIAQKVEQGLGRSVRGEKDYSVIVLIGGDLVKFVKSPLTSKYFSNQTKKQIDIGIQLASFANEDSMGANPLTVVSSLMQQVLSRDEGWKEYYNEEMEGITSQEKNTDIYQTLHAEFKAEQYFLLGDYDKACAVMQSLVDKFMADNLERGWYLQQLARYKYRSSKIDANEIQKSAFKNNHQLLKPKEGITYTKLEFINQNRVDRIKKWVSQYKDYKEMFISIEGILQDLSFGMSSEKFELALKDIGESIGFLSERPDKEIKKGPDNLWCGVENQYFLMECKNEVAVDRYEISKHEAGQMNTHSGWFESTYGDAKCKRILIIPTKKLSYHGNFTHEVQIMRQKGLTHLKNSIKNFFKEFEKFTWNEMSSQNIQTSIDVHNLSIASLLSEYTESYIHNKQSESK
jgi:replicative superfamily II helicase